MTRGIILRNNPFIVHDVEDISNAIVRDKDFYEHEILDYLVQNYPKHRRIIDVGANIGNHTVFFGKYLECDTIVAFEPEAKNYALLLKNLEVNKLTNVIPIMGALSNKNGPIGLFPHSTNYGAHQVHSDFDPATDQVVNAYMLDNFMYVDVTLMKIDIEYHEPQMLAGAIGTIKRCKPLILIEDVEEKYSELLPNYELIQVFPHYRNYLYAWKND